MLLDTLKSEVIVAMKSGDHVKRDVLKVVIGEVQTAESRNQKVTDDLIYKMIRKVIEGNTETLNQIVRTHKLSKENLILGAFLPKLLNKDEIRAALKDVAITGHMKQGQVVGQCVSMLKSKGLAFESKDVAEIVSEWITKS